LSHFDPEKRVFSEPSTSSSSSSTLGLAPYHNDYPPIQLILKLIEADHPGQGFGELETPLLDAGLVASSQLVLLPEDVLSVIGDIGRKRARTLRNYAKRAVLPLLGLRGTYEQPEIVSPNKDKERAIEGDGTTEDGLQPTKDLWDVESPYGQGDKEDEYESSEEEGNEEESNKDGGY
jgi:hypothetical protein